MLSSTGISPQAGGLLTQVTTLLNTFKNSSVGRYLSYAQMKTQHIKKSKSKTEQNQVTTSDLETGSSNQDPYATFLDEFGISSVPADLLTQLATPLSVCRCNTHNSSSPWAVSHVSSESFFKNKHGKVQILTLTS
ncbi:ATP-dependent zinc metalloprotease YME1L1-like [Orbicella faveolata]|uniref:ATP-dependent zinc metalloprotease YME1L1-like n=1 Tax=Orbicella faveolata TaxID=48498 RepID=UPI0009E29D3F|nr:ATP-dependent zinc metalloprotease YME1L1-like [Orbicella faveolata]